MKFGFTGETQVARCDCHKGQIAVGVFLIMPGVPRQLLDTKMFATQKEAEENLDAFTHETAVAFLTSNGIDPDEAKKVEISRGEAALAAEQRIQYQGNTTLH